MGLAKKLGLAAPRVTVPVSNAVPYKWSNQTYTMQEIMKKFKFPCVVQCATDSCTVVWSDFQFDLTQPLLLYEKRSVQKIHATSLKQDSKKPDGLEEIGPPLAIPQDYDGWFGAAPKGVSKVKRHLRIEGVANSTTRRFLVTSKCPAFTSCRGANGDLDYVPHDVMPGEVLKRVCVMDGNPGDPDIPKIVRDHGACLECLDEKDEDVIIPLTRRAITYEIAEMYPEDEDRVFQISSAIEGGNSKLPRIFKLFHGDPPVLAYAFTGMVRCYSVFTEETIVAATLDDPTSICLELATDSCARFRLGLNGTAIKQTCEYNNANQICETFGPKFITGIKVSFSLKPEASDLDDIDLSFYESNSDMQDVDANSEFEIAWGSARKSKLLANSKMLTKEGASGGADGTSSIPEQPEEEHMKIETLPITKVRSREPSESSDSVVPQHRDFTENEIADLMSRKGLAGNLTSPTEQETPVEIKELKENGVTDNPLFYFMQRNPDQNLWKSLGDNNSVSNESDELSGDEEEEPSLKDNKEKENPLLYLFQQPEVVSRDAKKIQTAQVDSEPTEVVEKPALSGLGSDSETNLFKQVVCVQAKEYSEDDDDESLESDENDSVRSEDSEILKNMEIVTDSDSPDTSLSLKHQLATEQNLFSAVTGHTNTAERIGDDEVDEEDNDELEAVDDLISLAEMESNKDTSSTLDLSVFPEYENIQISDDLQTESEDFVQTHPENGPGREDEAVNRLNSLLDEVSELVNNSSGRILDVSKSPRLSKSSSNSSPKTEKEEHDFFETPTVVNGAISNSAISHSPSTQSDTTAVSYSPPTSIDASAVSHSPSTSYDTSAVYHSPSTSEDISVPPEDSVSSINLSEIKANLGYKETPNVKTYPKGKKSKIDGGNSFSTGLADSKKSKSEEFNSALKRTKGKTNLASVSQKSNGCSPPSQDRLQKFKSESNVSSIFTVEKEEGNRFESTKVLHHPHRHPHQGNDDIRLVKTESKGRQDSSDAENHGRPQKSPRKNSLSKGIVFASVQNFEILGSSNSSINSNKSSGMSLSCGGNQNGGIDSDRRLKSKEKFTDLRTVEKSEIETQATTASQHVGNISREDSEEELVTFEEHYTITKSGKMKPNKPVNPRKIMVLEDNLEEDFV